MKVTIDCSAEEVRELTGAKRIEDFQDKIIGEMTDNAESILPNEAAVELFSKIMNPYKMFGFLTQEK